MWGGVSEREINSPQGLRGKKNFETNKNHNNKNTSACRAPLTDKARLRERTQYFTKFPSPFWLLYLSECLFLYWNKICFLYYQEVQTLFSEQIHFHFSLPCLFILRQEEFFLLVSSPGLKTNKQQTKKLPSSFNSFSWDMVFRCFTILLSLLECTVCMINSPLKTYHWNKKESGKRDIERIITSCDLNAVFLSYNTESKIGSL